MLAGRQKSLLVLSDLHLHPSSIQRNLEFIDFLKAAHSNNHEVLIAGDLFDLWFGWEQLTFSYQKPILDQMKHLASQGLIIDYVEGNRDFGITRYQGILFRSVSEHAIHREWEGLSIHIEHGDEINKKDVPYRLWKKISKNQVTSLLPRMLPSELLLRFADRLEKGMRGTNQKHKSYYPQDLCNALCERHARHGIDVVIVGHFHLEREAELNFEKRNVLFYNLPGWENGFRYLVIPSGGKKPYFTDWGRKDGNSSAA